jgi:hypothetical protein
MKSLEFMNLEVMPTGVLERGHRDRRHRMAFVPRDGIERLEFAHGFVAERFIVQLVFGALLLAVGVYLGVRGAARRLRFTLFLAPFGIAVIVLALRRGRYLRITTRDGVRKLQLFGHYHEHELEQFLVEARQLLADAATRAAS